MVSIPKRKFKLDIEGKVFEAKELSAKYLMNAVLNPAEDTHDEAIRDSLGELTTEDYVLFGLDTKERVYAEIVKFTFQERLEKEQIKKVCKGIGISEKELSGMSQDAQVQLHGIVEGREPKKPGKALPE